MARQLAFDLPARPALGRGDFFVSGANATALATLDDWRNWPGHRFLLLGPEGSGKTHLAHVWAEATGAQIMPAAELSADMVPDLARAPAIAIDDADRGVNETALFHLYNLAAAETRPLLITARAAPRDWPLTLPDLQSRMQAMPALTLAPPDDALLQMLLVKLFADRQIEVTPNLIQFLARRIDRSFDAARDVVDRLDAASLVEKSPITRGFAARVLDIQGAKGA